MGYATEYIARTLKAAREARGLSQRELSAKSSVPQGHISKIENGAVDLRVSSLVALARVLNLDLILVPRKAVSAVQSIVRSSVSGVSQEGKVAHQAQKELMRLRNAISRLTADQLAKIEVIQFQRQVRELQNFQLSKENLEAVRDASRSFKAFFDDPVNQGAIRAASVRLRELRNFLAHDRTRSEEIESVRPAYSLDDDDHG